MKVLGTSAVSDIRPNRLLSFHQWRCYVKIRSLYDRIVVKRIEQQEQLQGGLYIPDSAKEKPQEGEVVAVGKGKRLEDGRVVPLDVQVRDRILFGKSSAATSSWMAKS